MSLNSNPANLKAIDVAFGGVPENGLHGRADAALVLPLRLVLAALLVVFLRHRCSAEMDLLVTFR